MARIVSFIILVLSVQLSPVLNGDVTLAEESPHLNVVTTLPDYAFIAKAIGRNRITTNSIVHSVQDPHHIRPKPSFVSMVMNADVLISTGLDLELWLPTVINRSGNKRIRSGENGYVAVSQGIELIEKPKVISQYEGDVHVFGNPHITCSPIIMKQVAHNIAIGLIKSDPEGKEFYLQNLGEVRNELDNRLFGEELAKMIGGDTLCRLAEKGTLIEFLQENEFQGKPLIEKLDGWMKKMLPLRGKAIVVYHKNWSYFIQLFGLEEAATIESKPGIPPSPKHVTKLVQMMRERNIGIIFAANYFDEHKVRAIADRTGAEAIIVPLFTGGAEGIDDYYKLVDYWVEKLVTAANKKGLVNN
jgi:zinc/manganese transport system substrate-binding protein